MSVCVFPKVRHDTVGRGRSFTYWLCVSHDTFDASVDDCTMIPVLVCTATSVYLALSLNFHVEGGRHRSYVCAYDIYPGLDEFKFLSICMCRLS